jgi:hypothetical protein
VLTTDKDYRQNSTTVITFQQHNARMEITFHISYVILRFAPSIVISWTELSYRHTSYTRSGYVASRLKLSLQTLYGRYCELVDHYEMFISHMSIDLFPLHIVFPFPLSSYKKHNLVTHREKLGSTPVFEWNPCCSCLNLICYVLIFSL